jgi:hypothetical protein
MNYQKHYDALIERAKNRLLEGYCERHHIIPLCIGGTDDSENLVTLTPEEHYVAHQLLVKIYPENDKLIYAAWMMSTASPINEVRSKNKLYGWIKKKNIDLRKRQSKEFYKRKTANSGLWISQTKDARTKISNAQKTRYEKYPESNPMNVFKHKEHHKKIMMERSAAGLNPAQRPEIREKIKNSVIEWHKDNPNWKESHSKKIREYWKTHDHPFKGKKHSEDMKKRISNTKRGKVWINNGIVRKVVDPNSVLPEGFIFGRKLKK